MAWNINYTKDNSKRMISKYQLGYLQKNYDMLDEGFRQSHPKEKLGSLTYNDAYKVMGGVMKKLQAKDTAITAEPVKHVEKQVATEAVKPMEKQRAVEADKNTVKPVQEQEAVKTESDLKEDISSEIETNEKQVVSSGRNNLDLYKTVVDYQYEDRGMWRSGSDEVTLYVFAENIDVATELSKDYVFDLPRIDEGFSSYKIEAPQVLSMRVASAEEAFKMEEALKLYSQDVSDRMDYEDKLEIEIDALKAVGFKDRFYGFVAQDDSKPGVTPRPVYLDEAVKLLPVDIKERAHKTALIEPDYEKIEAEVRSKAKKTAERFLSDLERSLSDLKDKYSSISLGRRAVEDICKTYGLTASSEDLERFSVVFKEEFEKKSPMEFFTANSKSVKKEENENLQEQLAALKEQLAKAQAENKTLTEKLTKAELDAQDARESFDNLDADFLKSLGRIEQLEAENKELREKVGSIELFAAQDSQEQVIADEAKGKKVLAPASNQESGISVDRVDDNRDKLNLYQVATSYSYDDDANYRSGYVDRLLYVFAENVDRARELAVDYIYLLREIDGNVSGYDKIEAVDASVVRIVSAEEVIGMEEALELYSQDFSDSSMDYEDKLEIEIAALKDVGFEHGFYGFVAQDDSKPGVTSRPVYLDEAVKLLPVDIKEKAHESALEKPVAEGNVVENWANSDAVYGGMEDSDARIVDVDIDRRRSVYDKLCIRLENGHEIATKLTYTLDHDEFCSEIWFDKKPFLELYDANKNGAFTDEYITQMVSDIREALVGEKYGQGKEKEILRAILGDDCKIKTDSPNTAKFSDCKYGMHGGFVYKYGYEDAYPDLRKQINDAALLLQSNSGKVATLKEVINADVDKIFANIYSCKEIHDEAIRSIEKTKTKACELRVGRHHKPYETPEAHEKALKEFCEKLESSRPGEAIKVDYTFTSYNSPIGYKGRYKNEHGSYEIDKTSWTKAASEALEKLREDRVQSVMGDKELAAFGHSVRFHGKDERGSDVLVSPIEVSSGWKEANDMRAAVLIKLGLVTKQEGQTLADYRPNIVSQDGKTTVEPIPMLSEDSKKLLDSLVVSGRAITDLTPDEAYPLSRDFKAAVKTIEAEKSKFKQAKEELLADCQKAGKAFAYEGQNMTLEDVGKLYANELKGRNNGLDSFKKEAMEAIVAGYKEEKQKLADKQKGGKANSKPQDKQGVGLGD